MLLTSTTSSTSGMGSMLLIMVAVFALMYFMMIRPQRKEEKRYKEMMSTLEIGDAVMTTSGFYGVVIDINEETVIVEFGNNKNCRIPMKKEAITQIEKPEQAAAMAVAEKEKAEKAAAGKKDKKEKK